MIYKVTVRGISFRFSVSGQNPVARVDTPFVVILIGHPFPFAARCFLPFADQRKRTHMAMDNLIAEVHATINAPVDEVWDALVNPEMINRYMFGTTVVSEWKEGSKIFWRGEWKGKAYEDKGEILQLRPGKKLKYTHYSPLTGQPDIPENYHTVTIDLGGEGAKTSVTLRQDNNATPEAKAHSEENWKMMLEAMKELLEKK